MGISFNDENFSEHLRSAMSDQVSGAMSGIASTLQDNVDAFCEIYLGKPFDEVRSALVTSGPTLGIQGGNAADVDQWARKISEGHRIKIKVSDVEL